MRQNVFYSTLAVAVAPVAAMAQATYQQTTPVVVTTGASETSPVQLLTTTKLDAMKDYKLVIRGNKAAKVKVSIKAHGSTGSTNYYEKTLVLDGSSYKGEFEVTDFATGSDIVDFSIIASDQDFTVDVIEVRPKVDDKIKKLLDDEGFTAKVNAYRTAIDGAGYTLSFENNAELLLLEDICAHGGDKEYAVANFERFELYTGSIKAIDDFFEKELKPAIETDEVNNQLDAANVDDLEAIVTDENTDKDLVDAIDKLKELDEALDKVAEDYKKGDATLEELKAAKDKVLAQADYTAWMVTADKVGQGIKQMNTLLAEYEQSVTDKNAKLSTEQINIYKTSEFRVAGLTEALKLFKDAAKADMAADATVFNAPTDIQPEVNSKKGHKFTNIAELLGTDPEPAPSKTAFNMHGVQDQIAGLKYCAEQYQKQYDDIMTAIEDAYTENNKQIHELQVNFLKYDQFENPKEPKYYQEDYDQVVTLLHKNFAEVGVEVVKKAVEDAKKAGAPISFQDGQNGQGWGDATPDFSNDKSYVPAQKWLNDVKTLLTELTNAVADWNAKVDAAYAAYTSEWTLIYGNTDTPANCLRYLIDGIDWDGVPADVKKVKYDKAVNDDTLDDIYQDIVTDQEGLGTTLLTEITRKLIGDPINGFEITDGEWATNWLDGTYDKSADGGYASYTNLLNRIGDLKTKLADAQKEYQAYQALLTAADDLATRLKTASEALLAKVQDDATGLKDKSITYDPTAHYGYKGIGADAKDNTAMAKVITDYVDALKALAKTKYGDGSTTDAQTLLAGDAYKTEEIEVGSTKYKWSDINVYVKYVEAGGSIDVAVENYIAFRNAIYADQEALKEFVGKVKGHPIYDDNNPYAADNSEWNKYQDNEADWNAYIKAKGLDEVDAAEALTSWGAYFLKIGTLTYTAYDLADYKAAMTEADVDAEIAKDKAEYDLNAKITSVTQLYNELWGTDGINPDNIDSYLDTATEEFNAQKKAVYDALIDGKDPKDVFGEAPKAADLGDYQTVADAWDAVKQQIIDAHNAVKTAWAQPKTTMAEWLKIGDDLEAAKHILEAVLNDIETGKKDGENISSVVISKETCIPSTVAFTNKLAANKAAYDALVALKGDLTTYIEDCLKDLQDPSMFEETNEGNALIDIFENYFKNIPSSTAAEIEQLFKDCEAVSEGPNSTRLPDEAEYTAYDNDATVPGAKVLSTENKNQVVYWLLRDAFTEAQDLYNYFSDKGYPTYLAAKNLDIFNNQVKGAYDDAYATFDQAVGDLNKFKAPKDPELLAAFKTAFETATNIIYQAPQNLQKEYAEGEANMGAANSAKTTYDPTADVADINKIKTDIIDAFNAFVDDMQTALNTIFAARQAGYQKFIDDAFNNIDSHDYYKKADGTLLETDGKNKVFEEEMQIMTDFDTNHDMVLTVVAGKLTTGQFDYFLEFDKILKDLEGIEESVIAKMLEYAHNDLTNEIDATKADPVLKNAQELMGKQIKKTKTDGSSTTLGGDPEKDGEGNPIDMMEKYKDPYLGFGAADLNGFRYSYKRALGEEAFNALVAEFDELVKGSVGAAEELNAKYYAAKTLPDANDPISGNVERQKVLDLLAGYTAAKFNDIMDKAKNGFDYKDAEGKDQHCDGYDAYIADADYNILIDQWEDRFPKDSAGIASLYVGAQEHYADYLKYLSEDFAYEKAHKTGKSTLEALFTALDDLIIEAKKDDYTEMKKELVELKNEYNLMIKELDDKIAAETDPAKKAALEAQRTDLIAKYEKPGDDLNIDENLATLEDYEDKILLTPDDQSDDATYEEYVALEHKIGLIKTEIAKERGTQTDETIAQIGTDLLARVKALLEMKSKYFDTEMLVLDPQNPQADGDLYDDFGLFKNYTNDDYEYYLGSLNTWEIHELAHISASIQQHIDAGDILLYEANLDNEIKKFEAGGKYDIAKIYDYYFSENLDDGHESGYEENQRLLAAAAAQKTQYERLLAEIQATNDLLAKAKTDIAGLGLKDADGNDITGDFAKTEAVIAKLGVRANVYYLCLQKPITDEVTLMKQKYTKPDPDWYYLYKDYYAEQEITDEWLEQWGLTDVYDKTTGKVTLQGTIGLNLVNQSIADEVQKYVNQKAAEKYAEAEAAYNEALALLNSTEMRTEDKEAMRGKLYGNTIADKKDGGFQEDLAGLEEESATRDINTIAKFVEDVDKFIKALKGDGTTPGFEDEIASYKAGDFDGNGVVDIFDLSALQSLVIQPADQKLLTPEEFDAYDINNDGFIDLVDLGILTDILVGDTDYLYADGTLSARSARSNETLSANVIANDGNTQRIAISLNNQREYTGFQMDITLPQGMRLAGQSLGDRANGQQLYANEWDGKTRIVAFTMSKAAFTGNDGAVLYLDVETDETFKGGSVRFEDILFLTTDSKGVRFNMTGDATSIMDRIADTAKETIYNVSGRVMNSLKKGVNIIRGNGKTEKVIKK